MNDEKIQDSSGAAVVRDAIFSILGNTPGEDVRRQGLSETPTRFAKAWLKEWTRGYEQNPADVLKAFDDGSDGVDELILVRDIPVYSLCEHHLAPFWGRAHCAYLPDKKILGLSKFARVLDIFARRLQVQERLTRQVCAAIQDNLKPKGVGVILECRHMCMESRGVRTPGSSTTTSSMLGVFRESELLKAELFSLISQRPL